MHFEAPCTEVVSRTLNLNHYALSSATSRWCAPTQKCPPKKAHPHSFAAASQPLQHMQPFLALAQHPCDVFAAAYPPNLSSTLVNFEQQRTKPTLAAPVYQPLQYPVQHPRTPFAAVSHAMQHWHAPMLCSTGMRPRYAALACAHAMQHWHAPTLCSTGMRLRYAALACAHAMQHWHAPMLCSTGMRPRYATLACAHAMQHWHAPTLCSTGMRLRYAALACAHAMQRCHAPTLAHVELSVS
jgi:hypothetical protein